MPFAKQAFTAARRTITTSALETKKPSVITPSLIVKAAAMTGAGVVAYDAVTKEQMEWSWKKN